MRSIKIGMFAFLSFLLASGSAFAAVRDAQLTEKIVAADKLMGEFLSDPEGIPAELLDEAKAVVIFPDAVRAGFVFTGQAGQGVALAKTAGGWTAPAFFRMSGMGVGFQIGGEVSDLIFVVRTQEGLDALLKHRFTMGTDVAAAAGPAGRDLKALTNSKTGILVYGKSKGLFAGVSVEGSVIKQDEAANEKYYGRKIDARQILVGNAAAQTDESSRLASTLQTRRN